MNGKKIIFIGNSYTHNSSTTNYPKVFASKTDMLGIQALIDAHLAKKAHLNFNYTEE